MSGSRDLFQKLRETPVNTTIILVTGNGPGGMQQLLSLELPAVPLPGEHIQHGGRTYRTLERSWRIEPQGEAFGVGVGLLVEQIAGPPHIVTNSGGRVPN